MGNLDHQTRWALKLCGYQGHTSAPDIQLTIVCCQCHASAMPVLCLAAACYMQHTVAAAAVFGLHTQHCWLVSVQHVNVCTSRLNVCTRQPLQAQLNEEHARQYDAPGAAPGNTLEMHSVAEERFVATTIFGLTGSRAGMQMLLQDDAASLTGVGHLWCSPCSHQSWLLKLGYLNLPHLWPVLLWLSLEGPRDTFPCSPAANQLDKDDPLTPAEPLRHGRQASRAL